MRKVTPILMMALICAAPGLAQMIQTDWSGGPGNLGPVGAWDNTFESNAGLSWLSAPGQLALSSSIPSLPKSHTLAVAQDGAFGIEAVDLDGDGDTDVIGVSEFATTVTIWYNDGNNPPVFTADTIDAAYTSVSAVFAADFDGDDDLDLVASSGSRTGRVTVFLNEGGSPATWTAQNVDASWGETWEIAAADVNSDGHMDVVGTSLYLDSVVWWKNDGQSPIGWSRQTVDASFDGAHSVRGGDIDGDGHTDLAGTGTLNGLVSWWKNSGDDAPTWTQYDIQTGFTGGRSVRLGDINGDGNLDVGAVGFNNRVQWWSNQGGDPVTWTTQILDASMYQAHHLQIADMNGDGTLDMIVAAYGQNSLAWYANWGGLVPGWTRYKSGYSLNRPLAVDVGDLDGDGSLEIIGSSNNQDKIVWYDATYCNPDGSLTSPILDRGSGGPAEIDWDAATPPGTSLHFQVRGGEDAGALGPWSSDIIAPGTLDSGLGRFLQYRVFMSTADSTVSPVLKDVGITGSTASVLPGSASLGLNTYPNPANPRVMIAFELPRSVSIKLEVYDARGRRLRTLADGVFPAGPGDVAWNGMDDAGRAAATGMYQVLLSTPQGVQQSKVTLVR